MSLSTVLAKALFDNAAESPEELAFRKGDILMVLEQEQGGGPGWWLCSLHGRQGIAPANRLRLLHTAPGSDLRPPSRAPSEDSVYLSPGPVARTAVSTEDIGGVYRTPPSLGEALYQSPGAVPVASRPEVLRQAEVGGRPRSRSSSGTRPLPDWDGGVTGRPRSPSLRGRDADSAGTLYQTPSTPTLLGPQQHRSAGGLTGAPGPENVYLAPSGMPRAVGLVPEGPEDNTYLVPRETVVAAGHSDGCYLVPRGTVLPSEEFYQTPTGLAAGVAVATQVTPIATRILETQSLTPSQVNGDRGAPLKPLTPSSKLAQDTPGMMYQTPTHVGAGILRTPPVPALGSPKPQLKGVTPKTPGTPRGQSGVPSTAPIARGKLAPATPVRGSPLLARPGQGQGRVPRSPNFARKPPPPAPPVRGVTRKDLPQSGTPVSTSKPAPSTPQSTPVPLQQDSKDGRMTSDEKKKNGQNKKGGGREYADPDDENLDEQVYDTPPSSRWQRPAPAALCDAENIYNTPRALPPHNDLESEVYNVPTIILSTSSDPQQQTYNVQASVTTAESEEDVYSVPSLPGLPLAPGDMSTIIPLEETEHGQVYSVPGPGKRAPLGLGEGSDLGSTSEPDCGIYNMPALTLDVLPSSAMSTSSSTHRLSVSSNGSGDIQWRTSLSSLVQSVLSTASGAPASSRDLATSLTEILSVWKLSQPSEVPPSLQLAWARLSDLLPALSAGGHAPPSDTLLSMVQRALEDSTILLQTQGRPRLPSQDSLSRRPLPALPVAEIKPVGSGMGPRKSSWIQERPLPPTPQPAFPLPLAQPSMTMSITVGQSDGEEEMGNEYAGIGLTPAPALLPVGDSVGYVKLQGKPEPPSDVQTENGSNQTVHTTEPRLSPSPPLPISLSLEDSELLSFYSSQSLSHLSCLADSIDVLFSSVQGNQPPRVFVSRGKSLIVTAHKLVFIGDTLSRLLTSPDLRAKVTTSGGRLCQALKAVVVATKGAAQNYPSVSATQEMVDRVAELSQHAAGFSSLLKRLAEIS
ncbi:embryonal Fyn-associated substrate [Salmo trutta]|uniref:Embryonal Fyn-associated substrate n=1 Tax=Salmo trutta TaxID=8032 RepID=A0A673WHH9_SALTR|nr:embryonal Fyn-associated substrate-like [Salmo trutta]XP_029609922.1 embryonal Fyn-associated substrate-like [Salmo trutta]